jgi:hypothetical protein
LDIERRLPVGVLPRGKKLTHVFSKFSVLLRRARGVTVLEHLRRAGDDQITR